ncbi:MAG: sugar ABC transporter permease [Pseudomonadota bacterium]|nr:sugar ABC transporter permease [Pseudomonadota bacterium]
MSGRRAKGSRGASEVRSGWLFVAPYLIVFAVLLIYPLLSGIFLSFHKADLFGGSQYIGFDNYVRLFHDAEFLQSVRNTCYFVILTVPALTLIGLGLALSLNNRSRVSGILRGLFFASSILSVTIVTLIWRMILIPDGGLIANILTQLGIRPIAFLSDEHFVLPAIALTTIWWCIGLPMMLFLAALQQVPEELYEAALLDRAGWWRMLTHITLPSIRRTAIVVVVVEVILQFQLFGQAQIMTLGGPNNASLPIVLFAYQVGFQRWDIGYAAAASEVLFCIILAAAMIQMYAARSRRGAFS